MLLFKFVIHFHIHVMIKKWLTAAVLVLLFSPYAFAESDLRQRMLSHVEKIVVVDSLNVDREDFLKAYRIRSSAGRLLEGEEVEETLAGVSMPGLLREEPLTGFTNEFNDYIVWAQPDTTGYLRIAESVKLGDGSWADPVIAAGVLNAGEEYDDDDPVEANAAYPFMDADGQTLYFAADNEFSLGGLDIFMTYKDTSTGKFLIPRNIGMPFNSEYDDYMLVLDSQTGVGWWASERNGLEDEVTIYIYVISDTPAYVDPKDENLEVYASLSNWESVSDEDSEALREKYRKEIEGIKHEVLSMPDFYLPMPSGKPYRYYSDFTNPKAATLMKRYLAEKENLEAKEKELDSFRDQYYLSAGGDNYGNRIKTLEKDLRSAWGNLDIMLSDIYKLETGQIR